MERSLIRISQDLQSPLCRGPERGEWIYRNEDLRRETRRHHREVSEGERKGGGGEEQESVSVKIGDPVRELRRYFYPISRVRAQRPTRFLPTPFFPNLLFFLYVHRDVRCFSRRCSTACNVYARAYERTWIAAAIIVVHTRFNYNETRRS